jgi:hypothetical protein
MGLVGGTGDSGGRAELPEAGPRNAVGIAALQEFQLMSPGQQLAAVKALGQPAHGDGTPVAGKEGSIISFDLGNIYNSVATDGSAAASGCSQYDQDTKALRMLRETLSTVPSDGSESGGGAPGQAIPSLPDTCSAEPPSAHENEIRHGKVVELLQDL